MDGLDMVGNGGQRQPAGVGELLSRIGTLLSGNVWIYVKLAVLPIGVMALLEGGLFGVLHAAGLFPVAPGVQPPQAQQAQWAVFLGFLVIIPPVMAAYAIYEGSACAVALAAMSGARMSFREAYARAGARAWRLIGMMFLRMLAVMLPFVAAIAVIAIGAGVLAVKGGMPPPAVYFIGVPLVVVLYVGGIVWAVWISLHLMLAAPACMAEDLTAWNALKRSGHLTRGGKWRMLGVFLLVCLMMMAAVIALEMIVFALLGLGALGGILVHARPASSHTSLWIVPALILAAALFYLMFALQWGSYAVTMAVLYDDQRFRAEEVAPATLAGEPA